MVINAFVAVAILFLFGGKTEPSAFKLMPLPKDSSVKSCGTYFQVSKKLIMFHEFGSAKTWIGSVKALNFRQDVKILKPTALHAWTPSVAINGMMEEEITILLPLGSSEVLGCLREAQN